MSLHEDVNAILDKHLPAELGDRLKERLAQAEKTEADLTMARDQIERHRNDIAGLNRVVNQAGDLNVRENKLNEREREVVKKEVRIELTEARAKAAEDKAAAIEGLVSTVFSNRRIVHTMTRSAPFVRDGYVSQEQTSQTDETSDEQA